MLLYNLAGRCNETDPDWWPRQEAGKLHGEDCGESFLEVLIWFPCCWENRHQHNGSFERDNQAIVSLREHHRPCWLTLWLSHAWISGIQPNYTHWRYIWDSWLCLCISTSQWDLTTPHHSSLSPSLSFSERMDRLTLSVAWHYSGPHFPFWDAWPHTAPSRPRSLPASHDSTSSQHITEITKGLKWSNGWAGLFAQLGQIST